MDSYSRPSSRERIPSLLSQVTFAIGQLEFLLLRGNNKPTTRGTRFSYTFYYPSPPPATPIRLSRNGKIPDSLTTFPIWQSITALDHEAMSLLSISGSSGPLSVHDDFAAYLSRTKNTICGRHPVGVLLGAIESFEGREITLRFVRYEQSSHCEDVKDSSVSYASAYVVF